MVIRIQFHKICIFFGLCICFFTVVIGIQKNDREVITSNISSMQPLIIDSGHGGTDGGAIGIDGTRESQINLQIAEKLNLLAKLCGIPTIMTRSSENIDYPPEAVTISEKKVADQKTRLRLIQDYPNGILYSIHQNTYPSESISGIQVLYGHNESSQVLGHLLQKEFNNVFSSKPRRAATEISNDIFLLKHCECTAVLIECGFISNREECKLLQTPSHQKKFAVTMLGGYLQYLNH